MHLQNQDRGQIRNIYVSKTSDHIQIKIKIPNPKKEHQASSTAPNQDLKDMIFFESFKIKIENKY